MTVAILAIAVAQFTHQQAAQRARTGADQGAASATGNAANDGPGACADGKILSVVVQPVMARRATSPSGTFRIPISS